MRYMYTQVYPLLSLATMTYKLRNVVSFLLETSSTTFSSP